MNTQPTETVQPRRRFSKAEKRANRAIKIAEKQVILANLLTECGGGVDAVDKYSHDPFADIDDARKERAAVAAEVAPTSTETIETIEATVEK